MKKIKICTEVPDDFEKGYCPDCPFSYTEYFDFDDGDGWIERDFTIHCILDDDSPNCPIEFEEEKTNE